jgi:hypothetical protein
MMSWSSLKQNLAFQAWLGGARRTRSRLQAKTGSRREEELMAYVKSCSLQFVPVLAAALLTLPAAKAETAATPNDPVAYCRAAGTIDAPDAKYKGPAVPDWMVKKAYPPEAIKAQKDAGIDPKRAIVWRCASGKVLICVQGNAPQCGKASTSKTPTKAMRNYCAGTPNAEVIPLYVIGHENPMIYDWGCHGKEPAIKGQVFKVDAQGYPAELWQTVTH